MQIWEEGYFENITAPYGAVSFGRDARGLKPYPRLTWTTSASLANTVDVWINLGPARYWNDSSRIYAWFTGSNERSTDMQTPEGNFYEEEPVAGSPLRPSDLAVAMLALYSIIRTAFVKIPGAYPVSNSNPKFTRASTSTPPAVTEPTTSTAQETPAKTANLTLYTVAAIVVVLGALAGLFALRLSRKKKHKRPASRRSTRSRKR